MSVMSTTVDLTEMASLCVKHLINVKSVTKSSRTRKGSTRITCVEKRCVDLNTHRSFMKPIKLEDASREKRKNATKKHKQRRRLNELLDESAVDEDGDDNAQQDEGEDKKDQKYLFYDIEGRQEGGYHIANLLIVQDENVSR